ncbi:MAG: argininosuccinate lyase [Patescibacteria group bacterium]
MTKKLWESTAGQLHPTIESYTVGDDYQLDQQLISYDVAASIAHVQMLKKIKLLTAAETRQLTTGLKKIANLNQRKKFVIKLSDEDGHTAIENYLIKTLGLVGKKVHTGRSRNDQILVALRLYMKDHINQIDNQVLSLAKKINQTAKKYQQTAMPGYTHTQKAMETTVGTWLDSFASALADDQLLIAAAKKIIDQNPLGSVSGFGEKSLKLDRKTTTKLLGFAKTQNNPMYCAYSRGKFELIVLDTLSQVMLDLGKLANDLVWFTAKEFSYFDLPTKFKTGSSAMPQKQNFDVLELVRANVSVFLGYRAQTEGIIQKLLSGYNRDFQLTKKPLLESVTLIEKTIAVMELVISNLIINKKYLAAAGTDELKATEEAYRLVKKGLPFRDAYTQIAKKYR